MVLLPNITPEKIGPDPNLALSSIRNTNAELTIEKIQVIHPLTVTDVITGATLTLPFIPDEIDYEPTQSLVGVKINGRNNPIYQYAGSEDTLKFDITWVAHWANKQDVLKNCRWLESLTKSNGNIDGLHEVFLSSRGFLFDNFSTWIVTKASYKLSLFDPSQLMMPCMATQELEFKRVATSNLTHEQIRQWRL